MKSIAHITRMKCVVNITRVKLLLGCASGPSGCEHPLQGGGLPHETLIVMDRRVPRVRAVPHARRVG
jgi:hypothetical protein